MGTKTATKAGVALLAGIPVAFLIVFFAWPVLAIILRGFSGTEASEALGTSELWRLAAFTVGQAAASTILAVLAGLPLAFLIARVRLPGTGFVRTLVLVPFVLPTVVVGLAFRALWPDGGVASIVFANTFFNVAVVARTVAGLWAHVDPRAEDVARALGASRWKAFRLVTLPSLAPAIYSAAAVVFLFCSTSFGVVLVLGGARYRTLETEIYLRTVNLLDLSGAATLSLVQLVAVIGALMAGAFARRRRDAVSSSGRGVNTERRPEGHEWWAVAAAFGVIGLLLIPMLALVVRSASGAHGWTLSGYIALSGHGSGGALSISGWEAAVNSLRTATDATLLAMIIGVLASIVLVSLRRSPSRNVRASGEIMDAALMLPLGVSAVTVGFGYLITLDILPGDLRSSPLLVPFAQALVIIPLVIRIVLPVLRSVDNGLRQAAATLGASPLRVWREIDIPLAARSLIAAAGFGYVVALGEFGATSFLARPDAPTLPVAISSLIARPGELNNQMAYAACAMLMVVTMVVATMIDHIRTSSLNTPLGEF